MTTVSKKKLQIAILTRPDFRSPRILAESLKHQLRTFAEVKIFYNIDVLNRLVSYKGSKFSFHFWLKKKIGNYLSDKRILEQLKEYDAIIISECTPNCFWKNLYNIERLKEIVKKPILLYEVYYLGNAQTQLEKLRKLRDPGIDRYDWHLAVSEITETRGVPGKGWSCVGLDLSYTLLKPQSKKEFVALVDFFAGRL